MTNDGFVKAGITVVAYVDPADLAPMPQVAWVLGSLAYHPTIDGVGWRVTHVKSGLQVGPDLDTEEDARSLTLALSGFVPDVGEFADSTWLDKMTRGAMERLVAMSKAWLEQHGYPSNIRFESLKPADFRERLLMGLASMRVHGFLATIRTSEVTEYERKVAAGEYDYKVEDMARVPDYARPGARTVSPDAPVFGQKAPRKSTRSKRAIQQTPSD
jgi:hypothetical protein